MWPQPGAANENMPKGYEDRANKEELIYRRGNYIDKAAKQAMKADKETLEAALAGDEGAMRHLANATNAILQEEHFGAHRDMTEAEGEKFKEEFPDDLIKGYVGEALEDYRRDKNLKK